MLLKIEHLYNILPNDRIVTEENQLMEIRRNEGEFKRNILAIIYPESTEEVIKIVEYANQVHISLYPISTGKNWGMGSKLPIQNNGIVVDLSRMNKILEVNIKHGYAVIEPGVTQALLHEYLQCNNLPYIFNVTGSSVTTSILGNSLDRGVGYFSSRVENICGMEIVLGNGELLNTGFGHYPHAKTNYLYPYGVGPDVSGLFYQSNFGIVTKAAFELIPKRKKQAALVCSLKDLSNFENYINDIGQLRKEGIINTAMHIANHNRSSIALLPFVEKYLMDEMNMSENTAKQEAYRLQERLLGNQWSSIGGLMGENAEIKHNFRLIRKRMKKYGSVILLTKRKISLLKKTVGFLSFIPFFKKASAFIDSLDKAFGFSQGIPSDLAMQSIYWPVNEKPKDILNPSESNAGLLFSLPIIPLQGDIAKQMVESTEKIFLNYGFKAYITLNLVNAKSMECVINLSFKRNDTKTVENAKKAINELNNYFMTEGFILYRVDIDSMNQVISEKDLYWQYMKKIKAVFDPNGIIAPGRYSLV